MSESAGSLAGFLLARVEADERAYGVIVAEMSTARPVVPYLDLARRILAECEAKRGIVELAQADLYSEVPASIHDAHDYAGGAEWGLGLALRLLALPFADHPDYEEKWKL